MAHMHYKGTGQMHSFRGLLADGGQDKIRIEGATGAIAWRITKFALLFDNPGTQSVEHIVKVYREEQSAIDGVINFEDNELLAAGFLSGSTSATYPEDLTVIFDNSLFSRNIWVTQSDVAGSQACNYYIELEEVKVSQAGMAQLAVATARRIGLNP